jgi:hypothetical protein
MGNAPRGDGNHWIVKSIFPARIDIKKCAYHKAGEVSPIQKDAPQVAQGKDRGRGNEKIIKLLS